MVKLILYCKYALGRLKRHPRSAAVVVTSLASGITANTVVFSAYRAIVDPDASCGTVDLVRLYESSNEARLRAFSAPTYRALQDQQRSLSAVST